MPKFELALPCLGQGVGLAQILDAIYGDRYEQIQSGLLANVVGAVTFVL
jgi:hypothetical protein